MGLIPTAVAISGSPEDRPDGFPCFECGDQSDVEACVEVSWPDGRKTREALCRKHAGRSRR